MLAVGSWIGFDIYRSLVKTTLTNVLQAQLLPLQTSIDEATVADIRSRLQYSQATLDQVQSVAAEVPTPPPSRAGQSDLPLAGVQLIQPALVTPTPVATESATTPEATSSAQN